MVFLSGALERRSQKVVDQLVAHEFAHVILRGSSTPGNHERDADNKIIEWGYAVLVWHWGKVKVGLRSSRIRDS